MSDEHLAPPDDEEKPADGKLSFEPLPPKKGVVGLENTPYIEYGNGAMIETVVYAKASEEIADRSPNGHMFRMLMHNDHPGPKLPHETDVVIVHFNPKTTMVPRANSPELVPKEERLQAAIDCMAGYLSIAYALRNNEIQIRDHNDDDDFYMLANTNQWFAAFLKIRCGFRGMHGINNVWVRKTEFVSEENIARMLDHYAFFQQLKRNKNKQK